MASESAELLYRLDPPATLGEGPIYRFDDHTLHFNDCGSNRVHVIAIDGATGTAKGAPHISHNTDDAISVQYFRKNKPGSYIALYHQGICFLDEKTGKFEVVKELIAKSDRHLRRMNDGVVDPKGRFWGGEVDAASAAKGLGNIDEEPVGRLWRYDPDGTVREMASGIVCSNGIGWSPDLKIMYLNDSVGQKVFAFDYDVETGNISNRRVLKDFLGTNEEPDGMVTDVEGNLWMAMWGGHRVVVLNPEGKIIKEIAVPAERPTCPTWGGAENDTLFLTSASAEGDEHGGHLYKYKTNTKGSPNYEFLG